MFMDYSGLDDSKMTNSFYKLNKNDNHLRLLLMPYFIENFKNENMDNEQKKDYIQNKMNQILGLDNEIEKILNVHNLPYYILPSYKRYSFETIIDDNYQKYFIGSLNTNNLYKENINKNNNYQNNYDNNKVKDNGIKVLNNNFENGKEETQKNINYEKINNWFKYLCFPNNNKENIQDKEIISLINNKNYRSYLIQLIFQYNLNSDEFLKYIKEEFMEKLAKITNQILSKISRDEFLMGKLITCCCFSYYTIDINTKKRYFLVDILKQIFGYSNIYCSAWYSYDFWSSWLKDDFESKENDIDIYLDENINYSKKEYYFISRITIIMNSLGINKSLIDEVVFKNLALKFLNQNQIEDLRTNILSSK